WEETPPGWSAYAEIALRTIWSATGSASAAVIRWCRSAARSRVWSAMVSSVGLFIEFLRFGGCGVGRGGGLVSIVGVLPGIVAGFYLWGICVVRGWCRWVGRW